MSQSQLEMLTSLSQSQRLQSKNTAIETFKRILRDGGVEICSSDGPNLLSQEQALVVRDIEKCLEESSDTINNFLKGLKIFCKKPRHFRKALLPTLFKKAGEGDEENTQIQQESLIRMLLKVNQLQKEVVDIVLDEITSNASEEQHDNPLRLLLNQLRYLPYIKDPETLATKLLDIMEIASFPSRLDILDSIPEIVPDSEYSETAKQLSRLLDQNEELSGAIIDCLNALNLNSDIRAEIQDHILAKIQTGTSIKNFPIFLDFLMADYKAQNLPQIFQKIRNALDTIMASSERKNKEKESGIIVIFNRLEALTTPKVVSEAWLTMLSHIKVHTDHRPVDLLVLFMLHKITKMKKRAIETFIRKRVKDGLFKCSLLEQFFDRYLPQQLSRNYFRTILEIGSSLLRTSNEVAVAEFASTLFKLLFNHSQTEVVYRQELIEALILLTCGSNQKGVTVVLNIFVDLLENIEKLQCHTVLLMRLLEKLDSFELKDVKLLFEILCPLTCFDESLSGLKDEIHMIIRKQLSCFKRTIKHRGIISAVVMANHIAMIGQDETEVSLANQSITTVAQLEGASREAAALLELTNASTSGCPELRGLYYDQLAAMVMRNENLDKHFTLWLYETITNDFQNVFVTEKVCGPINELEFSMQYNLNSKEEIDTPIGVNIAELTLEPSSSSILILAPHFRLLRLLHYRHHNGDLSSIDALLGCGVVLPKLAEIESLDYSQAKQVADCLFHCINWFREIISGFVNQQSKKLRYKVIQRLENLIELEKLLNLCLENAPKHKLPRSYFDSISQSTKQTISPKKEKSKTKPPRKKLKSIEIVDDSVVAATPSKVAKTIKKPVEEGTVMFRELDTDVVILLKYPLSFEDSEIPCTEAARLKIEQLNFILKDFVSKLTLLTTRQNLGLSHLTVVAPLSYITDCTLIYPNINRHFNVILNKIKELLETTDGRPDSPEMFTEEALQIKTCFGLVLESTALVFNWSGFQHSKRLDLLRDILKALRPEASSQTLHSAGRLIAEFGDRLGGYVDCCLHLSYAVNLIRTMEALYSLTPTPEVQKKIVSASEKLLGKRWYNHKGGLDCGKTSFVGIDVLVKSYLNGANVKTLCGLVGTLMKEASSLKAKSDCLQMLPGIDKANFHIFYRSLWQSLHDRVKSELQALTNNQHLVLWKTTALTMQGLMTVVKQQETKSNLICLLKKSIGILKIFLSQGIPILEIMLKSKPDEVVEIFKTIQTTTRFVHHLCCYSKVTKDTGLISYIPQFRLTLETLVYRVKAALVANGCSDAFWMGNLKNRDLHGEDIISQSSETTESRASEEDEEELPADDDSGDDIFGDADDNSGSLAGSEHFD